MNIGNLDNENCFARAFGGDGGMVNPVGDVTAIPPFFVFLQKVFWRISGKIFSGLTVKVITRQPNKQMAGLVPLVCT